MALLIAAGTQEEPWGEIVGTEFAHVARLLDGRVELAVVSERTTSLELPMVSNDELDWTKIHDALSAPAGVGSLVILCCPPDQYIADMRERYRIGINVSWMLKHNLQAWNLHSFFRATLRHELGHVLLNLEAGAELPDRALENLVRQLDSEDPPTPETEEAIDARLRSLENAGEDRVVECYGKHCLRPDCIMRQRVSLTRHLGMLDISECGYCDRCKQNLRSPFVTPIDR